jgi:hypothetical protein
MAVRGNFLARQAGFAVRHVTVFCEHACDDIIPAFGNPENRANELAESEYRRLCSQPVGEYGDYDLAIAAEAAHEKGLAFYETLTAVRQSMLNLLAAGLFHLIEQELANLCHIEAETVAPPTDTKICVTADWYQQHFGLDLGSLDSWQMIDDLPLVANTVKHAEGKSATDLRQRRPEFFRHPIDRKLLPNETQSVSFVRPVRSPLSGEDLYITEEAFQEFAQAAERFLRDVVNYFEAHDSDYFPR